MAGVEPGVRLVRAPNPSPMTHTGTNTWIVGTGEVAVIDPGPDMPAHLAAIEAALSPGERIGVVAVTHAHRDHCSLAGELARRWGAPVAAAGGLVARRRPALTALARSGDLGGGEGSDPEFAPDLVLEEGAALDGPDWRLTAVATPGHTADHLAFALGDAVFCGDLVMGWASTVIAPPDGDLAAFRHSCARLAERRPRVLLPGHGDPVADPAARIAWLLAHRTAREAQIVAALAAGPETPAALTARIYTDTAPALLPAAERNVLAHLLDLTERGLATAHGRSARDATYALLP